MIERVEHITSDPLSAIHEEEERLLVEELQQKKLAGKTGTCDHSHSDDDHLDTEDDTLGKSHKEKYGHDRFSEKKASKPIETDILE